MPWCMSKHYEFAMWNGWSKEVKSTNPSDQWILSGPYLVSYVWFQSFCWPPQRVKLNSKHSSYFVTKCGVPQGSTLGPVVCSLETMPKCTSKYYEFTIWSGSWEEVKSIKTTDQSILAGHYPMGNSRLWLSTLTTGKGRDILFPTFPKPGVIIINLCPTWKST